MPSRHLLPAVLFLYVLGWCAATAQPPDSPTPPRPEIIDVKVTGAGLPVVFIPGLATPGSIWDDAVARFRTSHTCYVVSIAGFGGQPPVPKTEHFLADVRDAIIGYLRARKIEHPVIVGHSIGGVLALDIGSTDPDLPGGLVIVDSLPYLAAYLSQGTETPVSVRVKAMAAGASLAAETPTQFANSQKQLVGSMVTDPTKAGALAVQMGRSDPATTGQAFTERMSHDLRPGLSAIKCPVLVLVALGDKIGGSMKAADMQAAYHAQYANLPQAKFQFFDQSRHFIMLDDPEGFKDALAPALGRTATVGLIP